MQVRIENSSHRKLIGKKVEMTYANNQTMALWKAFMPRRNEIKNRVNEDLISMQVYAESFSFSNFDINAPFEKWAAVAVNAFEKIPEDMESFTLSSGLYAVFEHKGMDTAIFQQIFTEWLPNAPYILDHRPRFELLGEKYKNGDPNSEEQIWIPIRQQ